jgi:hypothetical protein
VGEGRKGGPVTKSEVITEARKLFESGAFLRKVISRVPEDMYTDTVMLECGHVSQTVTEFRVAHSDTEHCSSCAHGWIEEQILAGIRGQR